VAFGHFGDKVGRKSTLVASLLIMGLSTFAIAFLPTYALIGWGAPVLLCLLRFGQGFDLAENGAGRLCWLWRMPQRASAARYACSRNWARPIGFIASNGLFLLLGLC
jgi:MFS family permease